MILKLKNSYLFIITLIFCFLGFFAFSAGNFSIPYYFVAVGLFLSVNFISSPSKFIKKLSPFLKTNSAKYLGLLFLWIILGIIISVFKGTFYLSGFIKNFCGNFFFSHVFPFFLVIIALPYTLSFKKFSKVLLIIYFSIFILGILEFISGIYHINWINSIFSFFVNRISILENIDRGIPTAYGFPRISSILQEPSYFAGFIIISSPIIYNLCNCKELLFKKKLLDVFFKKITFILMVICLVLTQSPIFLVFGLIITLFWALKKCYSNRAKILKYSPYVLFIGIITIVLAEFMGFSLATQINVTGTFLKRAIDTISNFSSMQALILIEPSLATRIGNFAAQFMSFMHNPIFGVGYGNINSVWAQNVLNLPFSITPELYNLTIEGLQKGGASILFKFLSETGIVGTMLLYLFFINLIYGANKKINLYEGVEKSLLLGLKYSILIIVLTSFYDTYNNIAVICIYLGIIQAMVLKNNSIKAS